MIPVEFRPEHLDEEEIFAELKDSFSCIVHVDYFVEEFQKLIPMIEDIVPEQVVKFLKNKSSHISKKFIDKLNGVNPFLIFSPGHRCILFKRKNLSMEDWFISYLEYCEATKLKNSGKVLRICQDLQANQRELPDVFKTFKFLDDIVDGKFKADLLRQDLGPYLHFFKNKDLERVKKFIETSDEKDNIDPNIIQILENGQKLEQLIVDIKKNSYHVWFSKQLGDIWRCLQIRDGRRLENGEAKRNAEGLIFNWLEEREDQEPKIKREKSENAEELEELREERRRADEEINRLESIIETSEAWLNRRRETIESKMQDNDMAKLSIQTAKANVANIARLNEHGELFHKARMSEMEQKHRKNKIAMKSKIEQLSQRLQFLEMNRDQKPSTSTTIGL